MGTGKPRGRPRKNKDLVKKPEVVTAIKHDSSDLFKFVNSLLERDLTENESKTLVEATRIFIRDNFLPLQIFEEDVLKETAITNGLVNKRDLDSEDDPFENNRNGYFAEDEEHSQYRTDELD